MLMKDFSFHTVYVFFILLATAVLCGSCLEDDFMELDYTTAGKDVELMLPVEIPGMDVQTRADIADADRDGVKSLWIAVFSATTGEMTSKTSANGSAAWIKVTPSGNYNEPNYRTVTLYTKSGPSYIVGVANVDNEGVTVDEPTVRKKLSALLADGMTWTDFNKIGVPAYPEDSHPEIHINAPGVENGLPMSGCYSSLALGGTHPADWSTTNFTEVFIPSSSDGRGTVSMTDGAIHLRRLVSHITFNIKPDGKVIDLSVEGYRIFNVPNYSWLYERGNAEGSTTGIALGANFGDRATADNATDYYHAPVSFGPQYVATDNSGVSPVYRFDFWMPENKHTGTASTYNDREKKDSNSTEDNVLYTALTGGVWTPNNMASYVAVRCNVTYKEMVEVDDSGLMGTGSSTSSAYRTGVAEYIIHLGYIGDNASDFNSYRNTDYTYNINVRGLNEIVVEANQLGLRNSAEGIVTDVENRTIRLDAHFSCFNIAFTETELSGIEDFGYIVTSYESGVAHTYTEADDALNGDERKYIDWIELKSTTDATTLATYKPASRGSYVGGSDAVMPVDEFYKKVVDAKINNRTLSEIFTRNRDGKYYFTVFVNEYTYEPRYGDADWGKEGATVRWHTYVNQPSRRFYFRVRRQVSDDKNSVYARSKYGFEQQSIQTYYATYASRAAGISPSAIGVEHINEMQGLNLRSSYSGTTSDVNGRWNVRGWLYDKVSSGKPVWTSFVRPTTMLVIPSVGNLQNGQAIPSLESGWNPASGNESAKGYGNLPALVVYGGGDTNNSKSNNYRTANDPQPNSTTASHYFEAINGCMNRNRDENGNGVIDNEELKWYVPASGKYLRMILGRDALTDPIMPYTQITSLPDVSDNGNNTRWMMFASDRKVLWAMEGLSSSDYIWEPWGNYKYGQRIPWNIRCIRNMGTDLTSVENIEKVQMAYVHDATNRKVSMTYYDNASIRTTKITTKGNPNTTGAMHIHPVNDPLNKVYYAFEYSPSLTSKSGVVYNRIVSGMIESGNPCSSMSGDGWRLPNQKELTIMRNLGLFDNVPSSRYAICCTYDYFTTSGLGTDQGTPTYTLTNNVPNHRMMATRSDGGTRLPTGTSSTSVFYRCVRDVEP